MSRLDCVHAFRRIPPKRKFPSQNLAYTLYLGGTRDIAAEARCLHNACSPEPMQEFSGTTSWQEDVDGSSPSEGLKKPLQPGGFLWELVARTGDKGRTRSRAWL